MTKAPLGGEKTGKNPTDRGKLGTKRSVLTDGGGIPVGLAVSGANVHDKNLVRETIESIPIERPKPSPKKPQNMCQDKGYDYPDVRELVAEFGYTAHIPVRGSDPSTTMQTELPDFTRAMLKSIKENEFIGDLAGCVAEWHSKYPEPGQREQAVKEFAEVLEEDIGSGPPSDDAGFSDVSFCFACSHVDWQAIARELLATYPPVSTTGPVAMMLRHSNVDLAAKNYKHEA